MQFEKSVNKLCENSSKTTRHGNFFHFQNFAMESLELLYLIDILLVFSLSLIIKVIETNIDDLKKF